MRKAILALLMVTTAACTTTPPVENPPLPPAFEAQPAPEAPPPGEEAGYDLAAQRAKIAKIEMNPDTGFLSAEERSEEHTSELQSLMRISYAVFCLNKTNKE